MKNYWLNKKFTKKFQKTVAIYQNESTNGKTSNITVATNLLTEEFYKLAEKVVDYFNKDKNYRDDMIQECVLFAFEKVKRFDSSKGKAINFFITVMLGHLRQIYRAQRNYQKLKEKYFKRQRIPFEPEQIIHIDIK